ncbi:MAG: hypothetical protein Q9166_002635, partial [cf. Caloplaca sp. 2 TL-2023]
MPSPQRTSPRAAIREWLAHTDGIEAVGIGRNTGSRRNRHERHSGKRDSPSQPAAKEQRQKLNDEYHHRYPKTSGRHAGGPKDGLNVAERRGLHAPFRSFANHAEDVRAEPQPEDQRRKRRRKSSSSASYLEPAVHMDDLDEVKRDMNSAKPGTIQHQRQQWAAGGSSSPSTIFDPSPAKPAKTYEKRSRHKTREDRYVLKTDKDRTTTKKHERKAQAKSKKRRKGVQKSGAALMHKFSARNVEPDRLTLRTAVPVGLFGKGRASSPVRRKG